MMLSTQEWLFAAMLAGSALLLGALLDAYGLMFFFAAAIWIVLQRREFRRLSKWAQHPLGRPVNNLHGWQVVAETLYRSIQNSRKRTRAALRSLATTRAITNALPDAAIIVERGGNILRFNAAAERMLRLKSSDRGTNLASLFRAPEFVALVKGKVPDSVIEFASPFDASSRIEVRRIDLPPDHALILARDVTQLNRLLTMRQDFVANVSHELRTPLTVIVGYLETMATEDLDVTTLKGILQKLEPPTQRMRALVDDLLLLTRLEASTALEPRELTILDMGTVVRGCLAEARMLSQKKHRFETDLSTNACLLGVESEIYSACLNMITNAVRYSPNGGTITISWRRAVRGACFSVSDTGIGIPAEDLQRITERFYRVDFAKSRVRGGTGLGLAIVKHVLKRHHAELRVESTLGAGTTFFCDFPESQLVFPSTNFQEAK
jgi:two-component system phosphate regulon sensor histidine kinase PhoR